MNERNTIALLIAFALTLTACSKVAQKVKQVEKRELQAKERSNVADQAQGLALCLAVEKARERGEPAECLEGARRSTPPTRPAAPFPVKPTERRK